MTQFDKVNEAEAAAWNIHLSVNAARPALKVAGEEGGGGARGSVATKAWGGCHTVCTLARRAHLCVVWGSWSTAVTSGRRVIQLSCAASRPSLQCNTHSDSIFPTASQPPCCLSVDSSFAWHLLLCLFLLLRRRVQRRSIEIELWFVSFQVGKTKGQTVGNVNEDLPSEKSLNI